MDYTAVIELVGYDIIFLGLMTLLTCYVGWELWHAPSASKSLTAFGDGWEKYKSYLQGCLEKPEDCATTVNSTPRPPRAAQLIGMLLMASVLGMVINIIGDRMLDSDLIVRNIPFVWPEYNKNGGIGFEYWPSETWHPEDAIKYDALKSVGNLYTNPRKNEFQAWHKTKDPQDAKCKDPGVSDCREWNTKGYEEKEDYAKELFQRAYASVLSSDNKPIQSVLRYEYLAIKVLRTLFASSIILLLIAVFGPWRRSIWRRLRKREEETDQSQRESKIRTVLTPVLLLALPLLFLALWSTQSKRYDKKIFHAYLMLSKDDDVLKAPPDSTPAPTPTPTASTMPATSPGGK
jgi:hypothetical protein